MQQANVTDVLQKYDLRSLAALQKDRAIDLPFTALSEHSVPTDTTDKLPPDFPAIPKVGLSAGGLSF